jgi:hypothetical protein
LACSTGGSAFCADQYDEYGEDDPSYVLDVLLGIVLCLAAVVTAGCTTATGQDAEDGIMCVSLSCCCCMFPTILYFTARLAVPPEENPFTLQNGCNVPCEGADYSMCGGAWRNSVYKYTDFPYKYIGCYTDEEERAMTHIGSSTAIELGDSAKPEICYERCAALQSQFFFRAVEAKFLKGGHKARPRLAKPPDSLETIFREIDTDRSGQLDWRVHCMVGREWWRSWVRKRSSFSLPSISANEKQ